MTDSTNPGDPPSWIYPRPTLMEERLSSLSADNRPSGPPSEQPPIIVRELLALVLIVVMCDLSTTPSATHW